MRPQRSYRSLPSPSFGTVAAGLAAAAALVVLLAPGPGAAAPAAGGAGDRRSVTLFGGEDLIVDHPLTRSDFRSFR